MRDWICPLVSVGALTILILSRPSEPDSNGQQDGLVKRIERLENAVDGNPFLERNRIQMGYSGNMGINTSKVIKFQHPFPEESRIVVHIFRSSLEGTTPTSEHEWVVDEKDLERTQMKLRLTGKDFYSGGCYWVAVSLRDR